MNNPSYKAKSGCAPHAMQALTPNPRPRRITGILADLSQSALGVYMELIFFFNHKHNN
jgi:hypothetical protein